MRYDLSKDFDKNAAFKRLEVLSKQEKEIELTIKKESITDQQRKYYWVVVEIIALELGYTKEEMSDVLKETLDFTYEKNDHIFLKSIKTNRHELVEFTEKIRNWAAMESMYVPSPEEHLSGEAERYVQRNKLWL